MKRQLSRKEAKINAAKPLGGRVLLANLAALTATIALGRGAILLAQTVGPEIVIRGVAGGVVETLAAAFEPNAAYVACSPPRRENSGAATRPGRCPPPGDRTPVHIAQAPHRSRVASGSGEWFTVPSYTRRCGKASPKSGLDTWLRDFDRLQRNQSQRLHPAWSTFLTGANPDQPVFAPLFHPN